MNALSVPAGRAESETRGSSEGAQWTPPRPQPGEPKARREVRLKGPQWTPPQPQQGEPKATREVRRSGRLLGPNRENRNRDERFVSRGRSRHLLGPGRMGGKGDERFVSRGRRGRLLGPNKEGRKRLSATSTSGTDKGNGEDPPAVVLDGIRSPFPLVVLKCIFMFKSNSLLNPKILCFFFV